MARNTGLGSQRYRGNREYSRHLRKILGDISQSRMAAECGFDKSLLEKLESDNQDVRLARETVRTLVEAFNEMFNSKKYWQHEHLLVTFEQLCTPIQVETSPPCKPEPVGDEVLTFSITTIPGVGANFRPDPSIPYDDEHAAYCFMGQFHLRALHDCEVYQILMHVVREGRCPLTGSPGRSEYSLVPDEEGRSGSIKLNGENRYLDRNYHLYKVISMSKGSLYSLATSRYCKAARYPNEIRTSSIWYWIDEPEQILEIRYIREGIIFTELHHFYFPERVLTFQKATIRRLSGSP